MFKKYNEIFWQALFFLLVIPILLIHLNLQPFAAFDEARIAENALEMLQNKNFIVVHYDGKPDLWNTKPPLMTWVIATGFTLFGINEWALRFPSVIICLLTFIAITIFSKKLFSDVHIGILSSLVLLTTTGYIHPYFHVVRTGETDSLFIFCSTSALLSFFLFTETINKKYILITYLFLALAVLTKDIAGLFLAPSMFFYTLLRTQTRKILKNKFLHLYALFFIIPVTLYFGVREIASPGYLSAMNSNDVFGRYFSHGSQTGSYFSIYYFVCLKNWLYPEWIYLVLPAYIINICSGNQKIKNLSHYLMLNIVIFLLIISFSHTKAIWYVAPIFPMTALLIGMSCWIIYSFLLSERIQRQWVAFLLAGALFLFPYFSILYRIVNLPIAAEDYSSLAVYIKTQKQALENFPGFIFIDSKSDQAVKFYSSAFNYDNKKVELKTEFDTLQTNQVIVSCELNAKKKLLADYNVNMMNEEDSCFTAKILSVKN